MPSGAPGRALSGDDADTCGVVAQDATKMRGVSACDRAAAWVSSPAHLTTAAGRGLRR